MNGCSKDAWEGAMKAQEAILRPTAKQIIRLAGPEILGISDRTMRRWWEQYVEYGYDGLRGRRRGKPTPKGA